MEAFHDCFETPPPPCKRNPVDLELEEEPGDLLEKSWFFGNLLDRKTRMSRCHSDPYPSSKSRVGEEDDEISVGKSYEETYSSLKKLQPGGRNFGSSAGLMRTPSLPEESTTHHNHASKGRNYIDNQGRKSRQKQGSTNNLLRAPSLPIFSGSEEMHHGEEEEEEEEESDFSMSKLIRQASLKTPDMLPLPPRLPKAVTQSSSATRNRQRRKPELESIKTESPEGKMVRSNPILKNKLDRSSSSDFIGELKGLKNLSLKWENPDLGSNDAKPVIQKRGTSEDEVKKKNSPLHDQGQGWQLRRTSSSMEKRSAEDMKAQIKFWARAVASNVRQEC